jgi:hypothetical protein
MKAVQRGNPERGDDVEHVVRGDAVANLAAQHRRVRVDVTLVRRGLRPGEAATQGHFVRYLEGGLAAGSRHVRALRYPHLALRLGP